jgi:hypothetical protein
MFSADVYVAAHIYYRCHSNAVKLSQMMEEALMNQFMYLKAIFSCKTTSCSFVNVVASFV